MLDVPENKELQEKPKELEEYISNIKNVRDSMGYAHPTVLFDEKRSHLS
jgi:hypothetical protein